MHELRCFGRLAIENADGQRVQLRSRKHLALLLYLAAHRDRRHDRGRVARLFWDTELSLARHSLSQALYDLRQHVPGLDLDRTNREVGLGPEGLRYEGRELEQAVRDDQLGKAVELYDGPFAPDIETVGSPDFERWLEGERTRYRSLAEKALLRRVSECAEGGRWGEMCVAGNRLVDMNPLNEEAHRAVMRGLWLRGDREAALSHFEEHREFLDRELPNGPDQETRNLVGKIRHSDRSAGGRTIRERPRPEMVGREEEFRRLKGALSDVMDGESRFILIRGEAGIGKTRLLEEFAEVAELEDVRLLESRCYAAESDVPYGPIIDGLGELAQEVAESSPERVSEYRQLGHLFPEAFGETVAREIPNIDPGSGKHRLLTELQEFVRKACQSTPVIWIIDDCQWMDQSSTSVLRYIGNRSDDLSLLVVMSTRPVRGRDSSSGTTKETPLLVGSERRVGEITLQPLSQEDTKRLILELRGSTKPGEDPNLIREGGARIHTLSGGNPFYIKHLCGDAQFSYDLSDSDEYPVSEEMEQILSARLDALAARERLLIDAVAVAGRDAAPSLLQAVCELSTIDFMSAVRVLRENGLIKNQLDPLEFTHEIARSQAYNCMEELRRSTFHASIGKVLEADVDNVDKARLARHYFLGGVRRKAYQYAVEASRDAEKRFAHSEAVSMGELAIESATSQEEEARPQGIVGEAHLALGHLDQAESHLRAFLEYDASDELAILKADVNLLYLLADRCRWSEAKKQIKVIQDYFSDPALDNDKFIIQRVRYLHFALKVAIRGVDQDLLVDIVDEIKAVIELCRDNGGPDSARVIAVMSLAAYNNVHCSSEVAWDQLSSIADSATDSSLMSTEQQMDYYLLRGVVAIRTGRWDEAKYNLLKNFEEAKQRNDITRLISSCNNLVALYLSLGDWEKVSDWYQRTREVGSEADDTLYYPRMVSRINYAESLLYQEKIDEALAEFKKVQRQAEGMEAWDSYVRTQANLGLVYLVQRKDDLALAQWRAIEDVEAERMQGSQGRFKALWLKAALRWKEGERDIWAGLREKGEKELKFERAEALHTIWLSRILQSAAEGRGLDDSRLWESEVAETHRKMKLTWFLYYGRRWVRRALLRS